MQITTTLTKTPMLIFSTKTGTPYNLTLSNQPMFQALQICAGDFLHLKNVLKSLPPQIPFKKFIGCKNPNTLTYLTPYDYSTVESQNGCHGNRLKILCPNGYQQMSFNDYYQLVQLIKPDYWVGLTEVPSLMKGHKQQSNNSSKRAAAKTTAFLKMLPKQSRVPGMLAAVHGGRNIPILEKSLQQSLSIQGVEGLVLCDLCQKETLEEREQSYRIVAQAVGKKEKQSGKKYPIFLAGLGKIQDVFHAIKFGITHFEIAEPFRLAEKQHALVFREGSFSVIKPMRKETLEPLDSTCQCLACKSYSEAYIWHLSCSKQMTAKVLLSIHNVHQYLKSLQ